MTKLIMIATFASRIEALVAQSVLKANSIKSIISSDDSGGAQPFFTAVFGAQLLVKESDVKKAIKILKL